MKIAFVGKGGSGKTTLTAAFCSYIKKQRRYPILAIDADINVHLGPLLGLGDNKKELYISRPETIAKIKEWLRGSNSKIRELAHFRKTTPPANGSRLLPIDNLNTTALAPFIKRSGNLSLLTVGTYDTKGIGTSCYHNDLAILENILSHLVDEKGVAVVDMVAGVDAFANTLHAQFTLLILVVEPTRYGVEVFRHYHGLARKAGIDTNLLVVGNKIRNENDIRFLSESIPNECLIGYFKESNYLRGIEQEGTAFKIENLEPDTIALLDKITKKLENMPQDISQRYKKLCNLHRTYVAQEFIRERFGDLTDQIDESFDIEKYIQQYYHEKKR